MADEKKVEQLLGEAVKWLRVLAAPTVKEWLEPHLTTADERKVYQASTGGSNRDVAKVSGVSHATVSRCWNRWKEAAPPIVKQTGRQGRYVRLYDLVELNLPLEVTS